MQAEKRPPLDYYDKDEKYVTNSGAPFTPYRPQQSPRLALDPPRELERGSSALGIAASRACLRGVCKNDSASQSGRINAYPLTSLHCSGSSLFGASGLGPERDARRKRKGAGRRSVQQLPCPYRSHRFRIHARGLEDRYAHDDEPRREDRAGSAWAHDRVSRQDLSRDR